MGAPIPAPGFWQNQTSGVLAPVVTAYLRGEYLTPSEVSVLRRYLRQWIAGDFRGPEVDELRRSVDGILTSRDVRAWIGRAIAAGCDPLSVK